MFLASLAASCGKETADRIGIVAEKMHTGGAKVWMNPASVNAATWVANETVDLNGSSYAIDDNGDGTFSLGVAPLNAAMYAVYPATTVGDGNDIEVSNLNGSGSTVTLKSLAVNFLSTGGHTMYFPMEAQAEARSTQLKFDHLTGGLKITLANTSSADVTLDAVKIVARSTSDVAPLSHNGVTASWEIEGPVLPGGTVGGISGNQDIKYTSEMYFVLQTDGAAGATIDAHGSRSFCVPVTVSSMKYFTVTGYNPDGSQRFTISKELDIPLTIERNGMYNIPTIEME